MEILVQHLVGKRHIIIAVRGGDRELTSTGDRVNQWKEHLGVEYQILLHGLWMTSIIAGAVLLAVSQIFYFFIYLFFYTALSYMVISACYMMLSMFWFIIIFIIVILLYFILFFNLTFFCCMWFIILSVPAAVQIAPRGTIMIWINNLNQNQLTLILKVKTYVKKSPTHFQHPREAETLSFDTLANSSPEAMDTEGAAVPPTGKRWHYLLHCLLRFFSPPSFSTILHFPRLCTKTISSIINMLC